MNLVFIMQKFFSFLLLGLVILGAGWFALRTLGTEESDGTEMLESVAVERGDVVRKVMFVGTVQPVRLTEVKSEVSGRITKVFVVDGEVVEKGQLLLELDQTEIQSEIESLTREMLSNQLRLEQAMRDEKRVADLYNKDFATDKEREDATTTLKLAENELRIQEAKLATLEERLGKTRIKAPHDGIVLNLDATPGEVMVGANSVSEGDVPMKIADLGQLLVEADVSEVDLTLLEVKQAAEVSFPGMFGLELGGVVQSISPSAVEDRKEVVFPVKVLLKTKDERVKPGISALVEIEAERQEDQLVVPVSAVFRDRSSAFVFVEKEKTYEQREVEVGLSAANKTVIVDGLEEGDMVTLGIPKDSDYEARRGEVSRWSVWR